MKFLIYSDPHFCTYSSILRSRGSVFSTRLENLIQSLSWAEKQAVTNNCDAVICLGDFFDTATLTAEELTALQEITWANLPHYMVVGNHCISRGDLSFNTLNTLGTLSIMKIIDKVSDIELDNCDLVFIPYQSKETRKAFSEYLPKSNKPKIVFSHNDIAGIRYGGFLSTNGFDINEIFNSCKLFINGHLHNGGYWLDKNHVAINVGNLTGQNFSEDAFTYHHGAAVLDTDTYDLEFIENPHAFNFYKIEINSEDDLHLLYQTDVNAIVSVKCRESLKNQVKDIIDNKQSIITSRVIVIPELADIDSSNVKSIESVDHIKQFKDFVLGELGCSELVLEELAEVCK